MSGAARYGGYWVRSTRTGRMWHLVETRHEGAGSALCGANAPTPVRLPARPQSRFDILQKLCAHCMMAEGKPA